jgi:tetratricopeptide (TPR) repeat protein
MKFVFLVALAVTQLGGPSFPLSTPYRTEFAWAVNESAADIAEMAAGKSPATFDLPPGIAPWHPEGLVPFARKLFGAAPVAATQVGGNHYSALTDLTPAALTRAADAISAVLTRDLRNYRAHESAALVLGAFGLREAAGELSDSRWVLNRVTAHLAAAEALRPAAATVTLDGQLARVAFLALANRATSGLAALDRIEAPAADTALAAWKRALRFRLTGDWRTSPLPANGSRLEKLEYFRARRSALESERATEELGTLREPVSVDFSRVVQSFRFGVEDGQAIVMPALGAELQELAEVHRLVRQREVSGVMPAATINARAQRLFGPDGVRVLPWGAWAEFSQRHIGWHVIEIDRFTRKMLGSHDRADDFKRRLDAAFSDWTLYPVASVSRTKGDGVEADFRFINQAIDVAYRSPELVPYDTWAFLAMGANYEVVKRGMPQGQWFAPPTAVSAYDAGFRARNLIGMIALPELDALVSEASADVALHAHALRPRPNGQALAARIVEWFRARAGFDEYAIDAVVAWSRTLADEIAWRQQGCALSVTQCLRLAWLYAYAGDEPKAVAEYERAFRDPRLDQVAVSNDSAWLVRYYERNKQFQRAYDLAQRAADTGSARGLVTLARLYEHRSRLEEAETLFQRTAGRYRDSKEQLAGFLYRQSVVAGRPAYLDRWRAIERELFPGGLRKVPATQPQQPTAGVLVYDDSAASRRVRLQAGDIIVGVDGWLVEDKEQFDAVIAFAEPASVHKLTAWRGVLFTVDMPESHGMDLQTHPLRGWPK